MRTLFADSGHWIALLHPRDQTHERAKAMAATLGPVAIVTTQMALAEALNHLSGEGERLRNLAVQMVRGLQDNADVEIVLRPTSNSRPPWSATPPAMTKGGASQTAQASWSWRKET